jgi:branched-chain amino acid transport system ATP-binding protein
MLRLDNLSAGYHGGTVLHHLTLQIPAGGVHAVVGPNGAGKTTLLHTIAGLHRPTSGHIHLHGQEITTWPAYRRARARVALVPQGRRIFPHLSVAEHLTIAHRPGPWTRPRVLDLLPHLSTRLRHRGAQLSGGEQQMLALARALLTQPRLLLLDEPLEGLAPQPATRIRHLVAELAQTGLTILLTSPQPDLAHTLADHTTTLTRSHPTGHHHDAGAGFTRPGRLHTDRTHTASIPPPAAAAAIDRPPHHWADLLSTPNYP